MYEGFHFWGMHLWWWFIWFILIFWVFAIPYDIPAQRAKKETVSDLFSKRHALIM